MFSRPVYQQLRIDPTGRSHLIVGIASGRAALSRLASDASTAGAMFDVIYEPEISVKSADSLRTYLCKANMGLRLYLAGPEPFLCSSIQSAVSFGLSRREVQAELTDQIGRDVYCVHCKHVNRHVTSSVHHCDSCGMTLSVRQHFSQRLGCYMGVWAP